MSKTPETREGSKHSETPVNPHSTYLQTTTRFFDDMEKSVSQYRQSLEDYQQECVRVCRNNFESIISAQQKFAEKSGMNFTLPEASEKIINDTLESFSKAYSIPRQISFTMIKAATQNLKTLNDNAKSFAELNCNITQLCIPNWPTKKD